MPSLASSSAHDGLTGPPPPHSEKTKTDQTSSAIRETQGMGFSSGQILNALVEIELRATNPVQDLTVERLLQVMLDLSYR